MDVVNNEGTHPKTNSIYPALLKKYQEYKQNKIKKFKLM